MKGVDKVIETAANLEEARKETARTIQTYKKSALEKIKGDSK